MAEEFNDNQHPVLPPENTPPHYWRKGGKVGEKEIDIAVLSPIGEGPQGERGIAGPDLFTIKKQSSDNYLSISTLAPEIKDNPDLLIGIGFKGYVSGVSFYPGRLADVINGLRERYAIDGSNNTEVQIIVNRNGKDQVLFTALIPVDFFNAYYGDDDSFTSFYRSNRIFVYGDGRVTISQTQYLQESYTIVNGERKWFVYHAASNYAAETEIGKIDWGDITRSHRITAKVHVNNDVPQPTPIVWGTWFPLSAKPLSNFLTSYIDSQISPILAKIQALEESNLDIVSFERKSQSSSLDKMGEWLQEVETTRSTEDGGEELVRTHVERTFWAFPKNGKYDDVVVYDNTGLLLIFVNGQYIDPSKYYKTNEALVFDPPLTNLTTPVTTRVIWIRF